MQASPASSSPNLAEVAPELTAARMQAMLVRAPVAMGFVKAGRFEVVSEQFNQLFAHGDDTDLRGQGIGLVFVSENALAAFQERQGSAFTAGKPLDEEIELVRRDGSRFWGRLQATPLKWDEVGSEAFWVIEDVTAARQLRLQPTWTAKHDTVTELSNRRELERRLSEHVNSRRQDPVSVLWVDVDRFTDVINGMGAEVADHFLYGLGQILVAKVRATDPVARLEKDHFAIILADCDQHYAQIVAEKIRASIAGYRLRWGLHRTRVKASVGVVQIHSSLDTVDAVLGAAAHACAEAKAAGGDSVRVFVSGGSFDALTT